MIKKIFFTVTAFVFLFLFVFTSSTFASHILVNFTPAGDATWQAGTTYPINWEIPQTNYFRNTGYTPGLFVMGADGQPITRDNGFNVYIYDYPGEAVYNQFSGLAASISLPANAIPGQYKLVVQWGQVSTGLGGNDVKDGVITISNPSYAPFSITAAPTTWLSSSVGLNMPYNIANLPVGTTIHSEFRKADDDSILYSETTMNTSTNVPGASFSVGGNYWVAGRVYYYKVWANVGRQEYSAISPDILAPALSTKFIIGDQVRTNLADVSVSSSGSGPVIGSQPLNAVGAVTGGPFWDQDRWLWQIDFSSEVDGWVSEARLDKVIPPPTLTITSPVAGDEWIVGTSRNITWTSTNLPSTTNLIIERRTPTGSVVATAISPNDGLHAVTVPAGNNGSWKYVVRNALVGVSAESGIFTIASTPVIPVCGNNVIESGEQCDGANLASQTCATQGFARGTLSCNSCQLNTTGCIGSSSNDDNDDFGDGGAPGWQDPPNAPPDCTDPAVPGCNPPINVGPGVQDKAGPLRVTGLRSFSYSLFDDNAFFDKDAFFNTQVNSRAYCDYNGENCYPILDLVGGGGSSGVSQIIPGTNVTISPPGGTGAVTINASGGAGGGISSLSQGAGITLTPNPITTTGVVASDFTKTQARVTGTCPAGQYIYQVNEGGDVVCRADVASGDPVATTWTNVPNVGQYNSPVSGRVGIGYSDVANAITKLRVETNTDPSIARFANLNANSNYNGINVHTRADDANTSILNLSSGLTAVQRFRVKSDGNVCIGNPAVAANCRTSWPLDPGAELTCNGGGNKLNWDGSAWSCGTISSSSGGVSKIIPNNNIVISSASGDGTGEVTIAALDNIHILTKTCEANETQTVSCDIGNHSFCTARSVLPVANINSSGIPNCAVYYDSTNPRPGWTIKVKGHLDGNLFVNTKYICHATCF